MTISDICKGEVVTATQDQSILEIAQLMKDKEIGTVVIIDEQNKPQGIVTDRDIVVKAIAAKKGNVEDIAVKDIMSTQLVCIKHEEGIQSALDKMSERGIRRVLVLDEQDKLCGIVSADDLLCFIACKLEGIKKLIQRQVNIQT